MASLSFLSHRERIIQDGLMNGNINSLDEFSRLDDHELSLKMFEKAGSIIKEGEKLVVEMNTKRSIANRNSKTIPKNTTIRKNM